MSVLFIGKRFYTNRDALSEKYGRIYQLPWHWSQMGITTKLWLIDYHTNVSHQEQEGSLEVISTPVRNLTILQQWSKEASKRDEKFDTIIASGDCYIGWLTYLLARRTRARFVFDVYDKYDEFSGYRSPPGFDLFAYLLRKADARLFASRALMDALGTLSVDHVVPNGLDTQRFVPRDMHASRKIMGLPKNGLLIGYFGGMEPDRGVSDLITALTLLRNQGLEIQLILGGKPPPQLDLTQPGILYIGNVPYEKIPDALAACNLLSVPYRRSAFMDAGSSNKIAEAIACERPIVATRTPNLLTNFPEQAKQLETLLATPGDPVSIAHSIRQQIQQRVLVNMPEGMSWQSIARKVANDLALIGPTP